MAKVGTARAFMSGRSQHVTIPAAHRFQVDQLEVHTGAAPGGLSLIPPKKRMTREEIEDLFRKFDELNAKDEFEIERDHSFPPERDLF